MDLSQMQPVIDDLDAKIAAERESLHRLIDESNARTMAYMIQRDKLLDALKSVSNAILKGASPSQDARVAETGVPGKAASLIVKALTEAGQAGLSGSEVNKAVALGQMSQDAADKAKSRLKQGGMVEHDERARRWYAKGMRPGAPVAEGTEKA